MLFIVCFSVLVVIAFICMLLLSLWRTAPHPVTFVIVDIKDNNHYILPDCKESKITALKDIQTDQTTYKCGEAGIVNEILIVYR